MCIVGSGMFTSLCTFWVAVSCFALPLKLYLRGQNAKWNLIRYILHQCSCKRSMKELASRRQRDRTFLFTERKRSSQRMVTTPTNRCHSKYLLVQIAFGILTSHNLTAIMADTLLIPSKLLSSHLNRVTLHFKKCLL